MADNDILDELFDELGLSDNGTPGQGQEPIEDDSDENPATPSGKGNDTKAYSERLKKDRDKLAKQLGFNSWDEALENRQNNTMLDNGLDPDTVRPVLKDLLKNDPDFIALSEYKKNKEEIEKKIWAENELKKLNDKFGLSISDINKLDKNVIDLWNNGLSLEKAYAAEHYEELRTASEKRGANKQTGKDHLVNPGNHGAGTDVIKKATPEQIKAFKMLNPGVTDEDIIKYINR